MASVEILNATQANVEAPVEIQLSLSNPIYRGPEGKKPVKGVDYFTQEDIDSIVAQIEGGEGIDLDGYATKEYVNEAIGGVIVSETDPTVPEWAKQENKPVYTAQEIGALPADTVLFSGNYEDLSNKPTIPVVPTNISSFTNDAGYLTEHQSLNDYATKNYVEEIVRGIETGALKRAVVEELPTEEIDEDTIYMVPKTNSTNDAYDEYLYVNNSWEHIGSTDVDLTNYRKAIYLSTKGMSPDANTVSELTKIRSFIIDELQLSNSDITPQLPSYDIYIDGQLVSYLGRDGNSITFYIQNKITLYRYFWNPNQSVFGYNGTYTPSGDSLTVSVDNRVGGASTSIGKNFKYIKDNYVKNTDMPAYLTNSDILAIWNGENN